MILVGVCAYSNQANARFIGTRIHDIELARDVGIFQTASGSITKTNGESPFPERLIWENGRFDTIGHYRLTGFFDGFLREQCYPSAGFDEYGFAIKKINALFVRIYSGKWWIDLRKRENIDGGVLPGIFKLNLNWQPRFPVSLSDRACWGDIDAHPRPLLGAHFIQLALNGPQGEIAYGGSGYRKDGNNPSSISGSSSRPILGIFIFVFGAVFTKLALHIVDKPKNTRADILLAVLVGGASIELIWQAVSLFATGTWFWPL